MTGDGREWRGDVRELPLDERRRLEGRQCGGGRRRRPSSRCQEMVERGPGGGGRRRTSFSPPGSLRGTHGRNGGKLARIHEIIS